MQIALKLNPSCNVHQEKTKAFRGMLTQIGKMPRVNRIDEPCSIRVTGYSYASSENFPRASPEGSTQISIENRSRESLRGIQNRGKIDPGTLSGRPVAPKSVPGATRVRLGSVTGVPGNARRVPKNVLVKKEDTFELGAPGRPGAHRGN